MADPTTRRLSIFFAGVLLLLCGVPSFAQPAEEEGAASGDEPTMESAVLDVIVVTAQRREEDPKEVPISLSTLNEEQMEILTTGGVDVRFLSGRVPSLQIESSFGRAFPRFYIRGLGNTDFDLNASQPVSMVYDEVVLENPVVKGMPLFDLERTEVLRGPQGTLFGRNTPAGVVKFDSKKPTREKDGFARLSYGTFDTVDFRGAIGGPLTETLSARFSLLYQSKSDWVDNGFTGRNNALGGYDNYAARLQFLWEPNERFSGLLNLHTWDVDGTARIFRANIIQPGTNAFTSDFDQEMIFQDGLNQQDISAHGGVLKLDYDLGSSTLTSITGFETLDMLSRGDIDGGFGAVFFPPFGPGFIPFPSETADGIPDIDQFTQEIRLASNDSDSRLGWLVGVYYFDEDLRAETYSFDSFSPGNPQDGYAFQDQQAESWALFGSLDYEVSDRLDVKAGLRYTSDKKDFLADRPDPTFNSFLIEPLTAKTDDDFVSWDLSAVYAATPETNVYGRLATSFRAPSIQGRILFAPDFVGGTDPESNGLTVADSEDIFSAEVGVKTEKRSVRYDLTAFWYQVDNQQITIVGGQFNVNSLVNADKTEGYGFEAAVEFAPSPEWLLTLGLSNNNTEIQDPNLTIAPCGGGCTILDPIAPNGEVVLNGNSLPHAPEWIFNGIIDFRKPLRNGLFMGTLDWAYHDEKSFFLYESAEFNSDSFEVGLRLGYAFMEAKYEAALFARNLFDEEILRGAIDFNNLTGFTNEPRILGIELVRRF